MPAKAAASDRELTAMERLLALNRQACAGHTGGDLSCIDILYVLYNRILRTVPITCIDVAIVANGAVLLVKRKDAPARGKWWVPGGRVYKGEMMKDAAIRKCREEVGIECRAGPIIRRFRLRLGLRGPCRSRQPVTATSRAGVPGTLYVTLKTKRAS
jgi:8-oxo-dGTP pyrophosphatase MutT (NUDIX family)